MTKWEDGLLSLNTSTVSTTTYDNGGQDNNQNIVSPPKDGVSVTDTIAAVTIAVLACGILITLIFIIRAIKKRRRAQQGDQLNHIPTVSTGIMGTGVAAYNTNSTINHNNTGHRRQEETFTWEPITPNHSESSVRLPHRGDNSI